MLKIKYNMLSLFSTGIPAEGRTKLNPEPGVIEPYQSSHKFGLCEPVMYVG
jgi:hypothetical protein